METNHGDWHVNRLELGNFRNFDSLTIDFDERLTVIVGTNGTGKTAVLDALAIMLSTVLRNFGASTRGFQLADAREIPGDLSSQDSVAQMSQQFPVSAEIELTTGSWTYTWPRIRSSARGRTSWGEKNSPVGVDMTRLWDEANNPDTADVTLPVIALYGVERLIGVRRATGNISRSRAGAYDAALVGQSDLRRLSQYFSALTLTEFQATKKGVQAHAASAQLDAISQACTEILEGTGWGSPEWNPVVGELTLTHTEHGTLPLSYMSSGIRIAAGLVIDIVSRMARANPHLGSHDLRSAVPGIVMIDEVDLHLHPVWQQQILIRLRHVLPQVQLIVTTHSPQVLSTVPPECIRILDGAEVRRVDYSAGLRSDIVLAQVMGTDPEPRLDVNRKLDDYLDMVDRGEGRSTAARELRRELNAELGGISRAPRLAEADAVMAFEDLDD